MSIPRPPETAITFPNDPPIELTYKDSVSYINKNSYDNGKMTAGFVWHMMLVHHRSKYSKRAILEALFQAVGDEEFFPIMYKEGPKIDWFLMRQCQRALDKLFLKNLCITMPNGNTLKLEVILQVGKYVHGQISPTKRIEKALDELSKKLEDGGILNLSEFGMNPVFSDIVVDLRNRAVFQLVCNTVYRREEQFRRVNGIRLKNNYLTSLVPMNAFNGCEFDLLDLSNNLLHSASRICKALKEIKIQRLYLANNPITEGEDYPLNMKNLFPNFVKLDDRTIEELRTMVKPAERDDEDMAGKLIDPLQPHRLKKFENNDDWNSITIQNLENYTKQELLDAFFDTLSPELSEIYPCNYKEETKEHVFYVRECYEQLKYLVNNCKLQIFAPHSDSRKILIQLRMKVKSFDNDPLDAVKTIAKAITSRYNSKDRILNLEDFNSDPALKNVEVNLRSPKVLNRVLTQASNRFSKQIVELRLGKNRIESCNFAKPFLQMYHLKVLDLSHNNLRDFSEFMELEKLPIKSLNLNGNPLCNVYTYAPNYIKAATNLFPALTKLDNVELISQTSRTVKKNFLCDLNGYELVQEFVNHYFKIFESEDRLNLKEMYHPKAMFSMTCNYSLANLNAHCSKRIARYSNLSRNILKMSDFSRAVASLHTGYDEICQALVAVPNVEHDIVGFTTDTTILNDKMVVITITGVFKDLAPSALDPDMLVAFSRTFILTSTCKNIGILKCATEYQIISDLFSVTYPSEWQKQNAFKFTKSREIKEDTKLTSMDKEGILIMFQEVTKLKTIWCKRLLDEGNWDFKRSIEIFLDEGQKEEIPAAAYNYS